jgi:hypothetical protein
MSEGNSGPGFTTGPGTNEPFSGNQELSRRVKVTIVATGVISIARSDYDDEESGEKNWTNDAIKHYEETTADISLDEQLEGCDNLTKVVTVEDAPDE